MIAILCTASLGLLMALVLLYLRRRRMVEMIDRIPGPPCLPILGNFLDIRDSRPEMQFRKALNIAERFRKEGLHRQWVLMFPVVVLFRSDYIEPILTNSVNLSKSFAYEFLHSWLGTGLLTSTGAKWQSRRKLLTPTFHFKILEEYIPVFNTHCDHLVNKLETLADGQTKFDISKLFILSTLDMICETAMGKRIHALENENSEYVRSVKRASELINERFFNPFHWASFIYKRSKAGREYTQALRIMHDFTDQIIRERKEERQGNQSRNGKKKRYQAFLDLLLDVSDNGRVLSDRDIREEVDTFVFEGHDTTGMGLNWATYLLGHNPEVQEKLQAELDHKFGDDDREITSEDLKDLKYLDCVIKECQRVYPSVPAYSRSLEKEVKLGEYTLPVGTNILMLSYALHRDPEVFPDPEKFDPDRFLPENCIGRSPFAYLPFSAGPRNCIGQKFAMTEMKITLSKVIRRFTVKSLVPREEMYNLRELVLRPSDGIWVTIEKRRR